MKKTKQLLRWGIRAKRDVSEILLDYFEMLPPTRVEYKNYYIYYVLLLHVPSHSICTMKNTRRKRKKTQGEELVEAFHLVLALI